MQDSLAAVFFAGLLHAPIFASAGAIGREDARGNLFAERGCCRRQSHFLHVGHDVSGSPVSVDIGKCRSSCLSQRISSPHPGLLGLSRHSSMLDFLRSKKLQVRRPDSPLRPGAPRSCPEGSCCEPARVHVERLLLFEGVRELEVVDGCHCSTCPEECLRLPALKTFFPDSPWEVTVDVGKCSDPTYSAEQRFKLSQAGQCTPVSFQLDMSYCWRSPCLSSPAAEPLPGPARTCPGGSVSWPGGDRAAKTRAFGVSTQSPPSLYSLHGFLNNQTRWTFLHAHKVQHCSSQKPTRWGGGSDAGELRNEGKMLSCFTGGILL
ncbi:uncharacterized protein J5F26_015056 isoform 1-T1 [Ciconia maguari]